MSGRILEVKREHADHVAVHSDVEARDIAPPTPNAIAVAGLIFQRQGVAPKSGPAAATEGSERDEVPPRPDRRPASIGMLRRHARARPSVIRRVIDDPTFIGLTKDGAFDKLKKTFPDLKITYPVFAPFFGSGQNYTLAQIREKIERDAANDLPRAEPSGPRSKAPRPTAQRGDASQPPASPAAVLQRPGVRELPMPRPGVREVRLPVPGVKELPGPPAVFPKAPLDLPAALAESSAAASPRPVKSLSGPGVLVADGAPADARRLHLEHRDNASGTNPWEKVLGPWVQDLYESKEEGKYPTGEDFLREVRTRYTVQQVDEPAFAYALQWAVRMYGSGDDKFRGETRFARHPKDRDIRGWPVYQANWTIHHCTPGPPDGSPPAWMEVKSTLALGMSQVDPNAEKKKSGHTTDVDWHQFGNVASTFHVLCVDGHLASTQPFLKHCRWYAEFNVADIADLWISSDWLAKNGITGDAFRGTGKQVKEAMIRSVGQRGVQAFLNALAQSYHNLEVKVPGRLQIKEWNRK